MIRLRKKLQEDGYPARGDGGQASLERWVAGEFPLDSCPSESRIRFWVAREIKAYREALGPEASK
jgi:hypothetical protein